jgi:lipopolysaccharide/colanic/teichoic acid biosynthesis glycosyltransferase
VIRICDILLSIVGLVFLIPVFLIISILLIIDSPGGVFYLQERVGRNNIDFRLIKFRTMIPGSDNKGSLTVGSKDKRITRIGYYLRKFKLDELPQILNVLIGDMSFVGPRPEVRKYVNLYSDEQKKILKIRPGITDYASIRYKNESEILALSKNPEETYIKGILPAKISLNMIYINNYTLKSYFTILSLTIKVIFK